MKNNNLNTLTSIGVHYQRQSVFSILSHCSDTYQRAQNHKTLGPSTSQGRTRRILGVISTMFVMALLGGTFFSHSAYAGTSISVANTGNTISFGSVKPSNSGSVATATDTLTITTDCSAGSNVYISAVNGSATGTNLVNNAGSSNNTISTLSGTTIGTTALALENNTWGFNTTDNNTYYGLPAFANATDHAIYSGTNTTVPIYYGAKVTSSLTPGKYTGQVLYTATVNSSCLNYTVIFNKNANDATGTMDNQTIPPATSTPLTSNGFSRPGYVFLGWSTDSSATTPTYTDGQSVTNLTSAGGSITLYAVWDRSMQDWAQSGVCSNLSVGDSVTLVDARDKKQYAVKKLPDGKCWMTQNLTINGVALTPDDTNIDNGTTYYLPKDGGIGDITNSSTANSTSGFSFSDTNSNKAVFKFRSKDSSVTNDSDTGYYNFYTATLGFSYLNDDKASGSSTRDICPKGWRLPKITDSGDTITSNSPAEFTTLAKAYNSSASWANNSTAWDYQTSDSTIEAGMYTGIATSDNEFAGFSYSGRYDDTSQSQVGYTGFYWSSSVYNTAQGYRLFFDSSVLYPQRNNGKTSGFPVRCVAKTLSMQNTNISALAENTVSYLIDERDKQSYTIYRWPSTGTAGTDYPTDMAGYAIMTKDLSIGYGSSSSLALSVNTSAGSGTIYYVNSTNDGYGWSTANNPLQYTNGPKSGGTEAQIAVSSHSYYSFGAAQIACPKGWTPPTKDQYESIASFADTSTLVDKYGFMLGGVFSSGGWDINVGKVGRYWASTQYDSSRGWHFGFDSINTNAGVGNADKYSGRSVRCIASPTIQDFDASTLLPNAGDQTVLRDIRDGEEYTVKRLPDGKVWMTQNLTINGVALTPDDTNIDNGTTYYLPKDGGIGDITNSSTANSTSGFSFSDTNSNKAVFKFRSKDSSVTNDSDTGYYNFYTATLGFSYLNDDKASGSSTRDICPKGWRLPKITDSGDTITSNSPAEFTTLAKAYNSSASWANNSTAWDYQTSDSTIEAGMYTGIATSDNEFAGFSYSGRYDDTSQSQVGYTGFYWSSSVYNTAQGYRLFFDSSVLYPQRNNGKTSGFPVRCVAK